VIAGAVLIRRLAAGARRRPPLEPAPSRPVPAGAVTVVIPARDEAARIGACLGALRDDPQVAGVIVVDDESSDATVAVASAYGARVVHGAALPPGWVGKPWALQQGLLTVEGDWILTLDADVIPGPGLVGALLGAAEDDGWDVVSAGARFICRDPVQRWLHASMLATLVYRFGPIGAPSAVSPGRAIANGQCILARRSWLLERGGFAVTGGHLTDDIALVRWLAGLGGRVGFLDGSAVIAVEMHRDAAEVWREWGRSLPMADVTPAWQQAADLALIWLTMAAPPIRLATSRATAVDVGLLALRVAVSGALRGVYDGAGAPVWAAALADPATAARLTQGALRPARVWRGRSYPSRPGGSAAR